MYDRFIKRGIDLIISSFALLLLAPILLIVAITVKLRIGSPIVFSQERPGKNGKVFRMYKFRSMTNQTNSKGELLPDKERLTSYGVFLRKTSLDETLGLYNVLKGDMSLVGPRPLLVSYLPRYSEEQMHRHDVRPGLTGLAQVNGRNNTTWEERFKYDLEYIKNESFFLDVKIVCLTISKILKREGINEEGQVTMTEFMGNKK